MKIRKRYHWKPFITVFLILTLLYSGQALSDEFDYDQLLTQTAESGVVPESYLLTGAATYRLPIKVPPGRAGIQPNLALVYNSYRGNGIAGVGWALNISSIQRSKKGGVVYSGTDFEFHTGNSVKKLVPISIQDGTYRPKVEENFSKFTLSSNEWVVVSRDGTTYKYGSDSDSRQEFDSNTFKWCLKRVEDTNGNFMTFSYNKSMAQSQGQIYLVQIDYTDNSHASTGNYFRVDFEYESRPDPFIRCYTKSIVQTGQRLKAVKTYQNGQLVNTYTLEYATPVASSPQSRLQSFQVSGAGETLPPVLFESRDGDMGTYGSEINSYFDFEIEGRFYIAELNGDGLKDFLIDNNGTLYPVVSQGNGTFEGIDADDDGDFDVDDAQSLPYSNYSSEDDKIFYADVDNDGLSDLLIYDSNDCTGGWGCDELHPYVHELHTFRSTGNGTFNSSDVVTDLNAVLPNDSIVESIYFAEINGDKWTDMIIVDPETTDTIHIYLSDGDGSFTYLDQKTIPAPAGLTPNGVQRFLDINVDGLSDLVYTYVLNHWAGYSTIYISAYLGESDGNFGSEITTTHQLSNELDERSVHFVKANGDGLTDIFISGYVNSQNKLYTFLSQGDGTFTLLEVTGAPSDDHPFFYAGADGNSVTDLVVINSSWGFGHAVKTSTVKSFLRDGKGKPGLIEEVTNSLGAVTEMVYTPSIAFQDPAQDPPLPFIVPTLSDVTINDGVGNASATGYTYKGGYYDGDEDEFRGFQTVTRTNPNGTTLTTLFTCEDDFLKGTPNEAHLQSSGEDSLEKTIFDWSNPHDLGSGSKFVRLNSKHMEFYDNNVITATKDESYVYDNTNGLVTSHTISGTGGTSVTTTNAYENRGTWVWRQTIEKIENTSTQEVFRWVEHTYESGTGNRLTMEYVLSTQGAPENPIITMVYDTYGNLWKHFDAVGNPPTVTLYDTATYSFPAHITNPKYHVVEYTYDYTCGKKASYTDENGNTTDYDYDPFGRLVNVIYPDDGQRSISYTDYVNSSNPFHIQTDTKENTTDWMTNIDYIDGLGRKVQNTRRGEGTQWISTRMLYDNMGRNYKTAGPFSSTTSGFALSLPPGQYPYEETTIYDDRSRPEVVERPDGQNGTQTFGYEYDGFSTTITDPDLCKKTETKDFMDRIIRVIEYGDSANYHTLYEYNAAGDLRYVRKYDGDETAPLLYLSEMQYDLMGRKEYMDDPDMGQWNYTYDKNNNLKTQTDAKGQTIAFGYDEINRIELKDYSVGSTDDVSYTYDNEAYGANGIGRPHTVTRDGVTTTYNTYDEMGRLTSETNTIDSVSYTTLYGYDLSGKRTQVTYPDTPATVVNTSYHPGSGLVDSVSNGSTVYATLTGYTPSGKMGNMVYHNQASNTWTYDAWSERLTKIVSKNVSSQNIQNRSYTYSPAGDITQIVDAVNVVTYNYGYDKLHRLVSETGTGNYTVPESVVLEYSYNDPDHLHAVTDIKLNGTDLIYPTKNNTCIYDPNGNMINGFDLTNPSAVATRAISYDVYNMPENITRGSTTTNFGYDGYNQRVKKSTGSQTTVYVNESYELINGVETKYIFAGNLRIAKINSSETCYFHKDHLGSSTVMTDSSGNSVETSEYLPYGGEREQTGSLISNYKFTDQEQDTETGLYNYDARMYDPVIGRFISADSIVPDWYDPQYLNRYTYCLNNPIKYEDPSGHLVVSYGYQATVGLGLGDLYDEDDETSCGSVAAGGYVGTSEQGGTRTGGFVSGSGGKIFGATLGFGDFISITLDDVEDLEDPYTGTGFNVFGWSFEALFDEELGFLGVSVGKGKLGWGFGLFSQEYHTLTTEDDNNSKTNGETGWDGGGWNGGYGEDEEVG